MTIEELYKWAVNNGVEKYDIEADIDGNFVGIIGVDINLDINN
jgi:hypothetical protein